MKLKKIIIVIAVLVVIILGFSFYYINSSNKFHKLENIFESVAKTYLDNNPSFKPKSIYDSNNITLGMLQKKDIINDLFLNNKICSAKSYVKIVKSGEKEYKYFVNLICGHLKSKIDVTAPVITLNDNNQIIFEKGGKLPTLKVKKITDDKDKNIDPAKVVIDYSKVNLNKYGEYNITYKVYDSSYNLGTTTQKILVVSKLNDIVKDNVLDNKYYTGHNDNYNVWYSGFLWNIVKLNDDNTVKLVMAENITTIPYNLTNDNVTFENSYFRKWLNEYFYNKLDNPTKFISSDSVWCLDKTDNQNHLENGCTNLSSSFPIGLLTANDFNHLINNNVSYRHRYFMDALITKNNGLDKVWVAINSKGLLDLTDDDFLLPIRPVINVKRNIVVYNGDGSKDNPYMLLNDNKTLTNDKINNASIGSYISFSNSLWRMVDKNKNGEVKIMMIKPLSSNQNDIVVLEQNRYSNYNFDINDTNSLANYLNNDIMKAFNYNKMKDETWYYKYNDLSKTDKLKVYVVLPTLFDIFSTPLDIGLKLTAVYNPYTSYGNQISFITNRGVYVGNQDISDSFYETANIYIHPVIVLNSNMTITKGNGLSNNPYYVK